MHTISKRFSFSSSHQLTHLPDGHKCARLHGHNYEVEIVLRSANLDDRGFVLDYAELEPLKRLIDEQIDHRHLNDVMPMLWATLAEQLDIEQPTHIKSGMTTAENLAFFFYEYARSLGWPVYSASVSETPKTVATYTGAAA